MPTLEAQNQMQPMPHMPLLAPSVQHVPTEQSKLLLHASPSSACPEQALFLQYID